MSISKTATPSARSGADRGDTQPASRPAHLGFEIRRVWPIAALCGLWLLLSSVVFAPRDQWYLGYVCMVPWLIVIGGTAIARRVYVASWLMGFAFFLINIHWIEAPTGAGYIALSAYLACYFPLSACPIRHAVRRRRLPLSIAFPIVWVGAEFVRTLGYIAFPWFFLAHSQYKMLTMIQISDLAGAYGVSFVLAAINGAVADVIFARFGEGGTAARRSQLRRARTGVALAVVLMVSALAYGRYRLGEETIAPGPRVAILQNDYPNYTDLEKIRQQPGPLKKKEAYFDMMSAADAETPDLFLFPETAWGGMYLNEEMLQAPDDAFVNMYFLNWREWSRRCYGAFQKWCRETNASIVVGSASMIPTPLSLRATEIMYNSAFHITPAGGKPERHDKIHPVLFGEMVPFRFGRLRFLYLWFNSLSPFGQGGFEYSLSAGDDVREFTMRTRSGDATYHFGVPICYEDVMPYVCRRFVWDRTEQRKRVDFLLNISNDGWFLHSAELPQHFAICTFRAVENRVGIARAVNTGVSGFIDPNGRAYDKIGVGETAFRVARVMTDTRVSLYSRTGDVFALACAIFWGLLCLDYVVARARAGDHKESEVTGT